MSTVLPRAVSLGGGHGQARTLRALTLISKQVTAIATVADDGGSSGRLRRELGVLPPGDMRMAIGALVDDDQLRELLEHRFASGWLDGHAVGNLLLVALAELEGTFAAGIDRLLRLLDTPHRVLPSTEDDVNLAADGPHGRVTGQAAVAGTAGIRNVRLTGDAARANPDAVAAIRSTDLVVLGPGSVCTSILPNLLVSGVGEAVVASPAPVVLVANLDEQRGEGEGRSIADHVRMLRAAAPGLDVDHVLTHHGATPGTGRPPLLADDELVRLVGSVHRADLLADAGGHDPTALASTLRAVAA